LKFRPLITLFLFAIPAIGQTEVNVYTYRQSFLIQPIFDAFTDKTGIKVNSVFAKKGLVERLKSEGRNSPADLLVTTDSGPLYQAVDLGLTQSVQTDTLDKNISAKYRDPNGHWFGLSSRARLIVSSKDRVDENTLAAYEDLTKPEFKSRICTRSGKHPYMIALTASMVAHLGYDDAKSWLNGVKKNLARKPQGNDRAQVKAIKQGECDIAIINSYYMGAMLTDNEQKPWADSVNITFPNQQDRGTHMNISGVSLTAGAPNKEDAIALIEFMSSEDAQRIYAEVNHEYPVNPAVERSALVASWGDFDGDALSLAEIAKHRADAVKLADEVGYDL